MHFAGVSKLRQIHRPTHLAGNFGSLPSRWLELRERGPPVASIDRLLMQVVHTKLVQPIIRPNGPTYP